MTKEELLEYEMPTFVEFVSIGWMQTVIALLIARKVNYKYARWEKRQERQRFLKEYFTNKDNLK